MIRVEVRSTPELKGNKLGGYAAVFDQSTNLGWMGNERFARGSMDDALKNSDVRSLVNHNMNFVLGRLSAGTLRLSTDDNGLEYEVDLPNTTYANDLRQLVERGDITGASIGFLPDLSTWDAKTETRTHTRVERLLDVSPVTFPAYEGTSTQTRSLQVAGIHRRSQLIRARARVALGGVK